MTPDNNPRWKSKYLFAQVPDLDIPEEWNFAEVTDSRATSTSPPGYEKLGSLPAQDAKRIGERDLVTYGLSTAALAPLRKPATRATKQVVRLGGSHTQAAEKKKTVAPQPSKQINDEAAPTLVASKSAVPSTAAPRTTRPLVPSTVVPSPVVPSTALPVVLSTTVPVVPSTTVPRTVQPVVPSRPLKRKEVPDAAPVMPSKEARSERSPQPVEPLALEQAPVTWRSLEMEHIAQSTGDIRSTVVRAVGGIDTLVEMLEKSKFQATVAEKDLKNLRMRHDKQQDLAQQLRESVTYLNYQLAREKANVTAALKREEEAKSEAQRQVAEMKAEMQRQVAEMKTEGERHVAEMKGLQDCNKSLLEELALKKTEAAEAQKQMLDMKNQQNNQGAICKEVVAKLFQTVGFGNWCVKLTTGTVGLGRHLVLKELMEACPELKLRKSEFGWDPKSETRANILQQTLLKAEPDFVLLQELEKLPHPLTLEEVKALTIDYDVDLEKDWGTVADEYVGEDDDVPLIVPVPNSGTPPVAPAVDNNPPASNPNPSDEAS